MLSTKGAMSFGFGIKNIKVCKSTPQSPLNKLLHSVFCSRMLVNFTAVQLVYDPFSKFFFQAQFYSKFQLNLKSDPISLGVSTST